ncbi:MAG: SDR family NAD(P)-dependent oxidoreductase, partial [Bacteriovoracia bacterium]
MLNKLLDASIFWSFDHSGFVRHAKAFDEELKFQPGTRALITGGTSGIGAAAAQELLNSGVDVTVTGRDPKKAKLLQEKTPALKFLELDMADWDKFGDASLQVDT